MLTPCPRAAPRARRRLRRRARHAPRAARRSSGWRSCCAAPDPAETPAAVAWLSGELTQRQIGVGWATLRDRPAPARRAVAHGRGGRGRVRSHRRAVGGRLAGRAARRGAGAARAARPRSEQRFLTALLLGDIGQGALAGVMTDAVAKAADVPKADVRRALMLRGDLGAVAAVALTEGVAGARRDLARAAAAGAADARRARRRRRRRARADQPRRGRVQARRRPRAGAPARRRGARVHAHARRHHRARARGRRGALALPTDTAVLDGEAIALRPDGRPEPFQVTASRRRRRVASTSQFFDVLHAGGEDLIDRPGAERFDGARRAAAGGAAGAARGRDRCRRAHARCSTRRSPAGTRACSSRRSTRPTRPGAAARAG